MRELSMEQKLFLAQLDLSNTRNCAVISAASWNTNMLKVSKIILPLYYLTRNKASFPRQFAYGGRYGIYVTRHSSGEDESVNILFQSVFPEWYFSSFLKVPTSFGLCMLVHPFFCFVFVRCSSPRQGGGNWLGLLAASTYSHLLTLVKLSCCWHLEVVSSYLASWNTYSPKLKICSC